MLGLSFSHILVVILVIIVLWRGQKLLKSIRGHLNEPPAPRAAARPKAKATRARPAQPTDLVECPRCGTYVPNGTICRSVEECVLKPKERARPA